jgi:hypothetical protein
MHIFLYRFQEKLRVAVLVSKAALQFIQGMNDTDTSSQSHPRMKSTFFSLFHGAQS